MSTHETRPSTPSPEYRGPTRYEDDEVYTQPKNNKRRNLLIGAVATGVAGTLAAGAFLFGNNSSAEHVEKKPAASAPANPGQSHEASPTPSEAEKKPEKMTVAEAKAAFEQQVESDSAQYEKANINFEQKNTKVALSYLDAVSDWTMAGASKENYEAWQAWQKAAMGPNATDEEMNSVPNSVDVGSEIADTVAEHYTKSPIFKGMDEQEGLETIKKMNARNIQLAFEAYADQDLGQGNPAYEASLKPQFMSEVIGSDPIADIQFEPMNNTGADLTEAISVPQTDELINNNLHVHFNLNDNSVDWAKIDSLPAIGAQYQPIADRVAADTSTPESR